MSSSASLSIAPSLTVKAVSLHSGPSTVSAVGYVEIKGVSSISSSGSTLNVGINTIGAKSSIASSATISGTMTGPFTQSSALSASATTQNKGSLQIHFASSLSSTASSSQVGGVDKLGQAHISTVGAFTQAFTKGFTTGSSLVGTMFISQNHLEAKATLTAHAENFTTNQASLHAKATFITQVCRFQSTASLTGNSVLLHGGAASLLPTATLTPVMSSATENPDIFNITGYIDKTRSLTLYIDRQVPITSYIDKELVMSLYIDKWKDTTSYIEKIVEKTLVRER